MPIKIIFAGTAEFSKIYLKSLVSDKRFSVLEVITGEDKKIGRKRILTPNSVKIFCKEKSLNFSHPKNNEEIEKVLEINKPDIFVVVAFGKLISKKALNFSKINLNVHGSLLPKYRGASPIQSSLLNGDEKTGISLMEVSEKMDEGDFWLQKELKIEKNDNFETLNQKLMNFSKDFPSDLEKVFLGKFKKIKQDEKRVSFCKKILKKDGEVFFQKDGAKDILNKFKAFYIWPNIFFNFKNKKIKLLDLKINEKVFQEKKIGEIFENEGKIFIKTFEKNIELLEVQAEGKKALKIKDFINGENIIGKILD